MNGVLRKVLAPRREDIIGDWRKLHNEELPDLYSLRNINRVIRSWRMRWVRHGTCLGEM
jgi:hypothetical protein